LNEPSHWKESIVTKADLPHEQRSVLKAAINAGYYETPRNITLEELSERLSMPRSTLRYRLRRAEQFVMAQFDQIDTTPNQTS
jgi:predicted DNA binding protein